MSRLIGYVALCLLLLWTTTIAVIRAQPIDDHTIRAILLPSDCISPCFIGIRPGITHVREVYTLLESHPWVGDISSHIDSGCCTITLNWKWNGKQPANLGSDDNTVYIAYYPNTGEQIVQSIAIHTQIATGYTVLVLGAWQPAESGALQGLNNAYVEVFYRQQAVRMSTTVPCPLKRWRLWQAPMTLALSMDLQDVSGMKNLGEVC